MNYKKAIINEEGLLSLEREGTMVQQSCPEQGELTECGDWCPRFHVLKGRDENQLQLCNGKIHIRVMELVDNRNIRAMKQSIQGDIA